MRRAGPHAYGLEAGNFQFHLSRATSLKDKDIEGISESEVSVSRRKRGVEKDLSARVLRVYL